MGVTGAAIATVAGQICSLLLGMLFHYRHNLEIDGSLHYIKPIPAIIKAIYKIGAPAILMQALMSIMAYGINIIFGMISVSLVTAFGIYYKIQQFVFFAAFGINNALIPIVAFNYGKKDEKRVRDGIKFGLIYTFFDGLWNDSITNVCHTNLQHILFIARGFRSMHSSYSNRNTWLYFCRCKYRLPRNVSGIGKWSKFIMGVTHSSNCSYASTCLCF